MKLVKIVTHHENQSRAAALYLQEGLIAIGYVYNKAASQMDEAGIKNYLRKDRELSEGQIGTSASIFLKFRDEIKEGDKVLAYAGGNQVALVGEIAGPHKFNDKNIVGDEKGDVGYPNQRKVKWWDAPQNFDRSYLPSDLSGWVARPGTLAIRDYDIKKLTSALQRIPTEEEVTKTVEIHDEEEIKDYMEKHLEDVEKGLKLIQREYPINSDRMDFLAKDQNLVDTIIEVKTTADDSAVTQVRRYMRMYKNSKGVARVRGIIVAEEFTKRCLEEIDELTGHGFNLRPYNCKKRFYFSRAN